MTVCLSRISNTVFVSKEEPLICFKRFYFRPGEQCSYSTPFQDPFSRYKIGPEYSSTRTMITSECGGVYYTGFHAYADIETIGYRCYYREVKVALWGRCTIGFESSDYSRRSNIKVIVGEFMRLLEKVDHA